MKAISDSVDEIDPKLKWARILTLSTGFFHVDILCLKGNYISFVLGNETGDLTSCQHRVNRFKEQLSLDFSIGHDEGNTLSEGACLSVEILNIVLQMGFTVSLGQGNLEEELFADE